MGAANLLMSRPVSALDVEPPNWPDDIFEIAPTSWGENSPSLTNGLSDVLNASGDVSRDEVVQDEREQDPVVGGIWILQRQRIAAA